MAGDLLSDLGLDHGPRCGEVERWALDAGYGALVGLDEAGRGPLAGPVVAAAVALPWPCPIEGLDDSKRLKAEVREALFAEIQRHALAYGIADEPAEEIDRINILQASLSAMANAWRKATRGRPELKDALVLVDGNQRAPLPSRVEQRPLVQGDARSMNIAAASILAKVTRDRLMLGYHRRWPGYGFDSHKGYPTPQHIEALARLGPCPIHRRSFKWPTPAARPEPAPT